MTKELDKSGLKQSKFDPWHFVGEKVIYIVYVEDIIFCSRKKDDIHNLEIHLRESGVDLEQEDDAAGLLWVTF